MPHRELRRALALVDASVAEAIGQAERRGRPCVCGSHCPQCCKQPIPLTPAEMLLIMDYGRRELSEEVRAAIWQRAVAVLGAPCPFLINDACAIYPVRPIACRRFLVCGRRCADGEGAYETRPQDLILPDARVRDEALALLLPWHLANWRALGVASPRGHRDGLAWLRHISTVVQAANWQELLASQSGQ